MPVRMGDASGLMSETLTVDLRPQRYVFLIRLDQPDTVEQAMRAASTLWGGLRSVMVPVGEDGAVAVVDRATVERVGCDVAINMTSEAVGGLPIRVRSFDIADPGLWSASPLLFPEAYPGRAASRTTDVWPSAAFPLMAVPTGNGNEPVGGVAWLLAVAALGGFYEQEQQGSYAARQVTASRPPGPAEFALAQLTGYSLLGETARHDVDAEIGNAPEGVISLAGSARILLVDGDRKLTPDELTQTAVCWWNARALRPALHDQLHRLSMLLPMQALSDQRVTSEFGRTINMLATSSPEVFLLPGPGVSPEDVQTALSRLGLSSFSGAYRDNPDRQGLHTVAGAVINEDPAERWQRVRRLTGNRSSLPVVLAGPAVTVRYLPPLPIDPQWPGRAWLRITGRSITGPRHSRVAESHVNSGKWDGQGVAVAVSTPGHTDIHLRVPQPKEVLHACFIDEWMPPPYRLGDKGRQAEGLLQAVRAGGLEETLLCSRLVHAVAAALVEKPHRDLARTVTQVAERFAEDTELSFREVLTALGKEPRSGAATFDELFSRPQIKNLAPGRAELAAVIDDLTHCGLLRIVLPVQCQTCGLRSTLPLQSASSPLSCPGCGATARFVHRDNSPPLTYAASSLLVRAQTNGTLIPAAATVRLQQRDAFVLPGVDIALEAYGAHGQPRPPHWAPTRDIDLLGWRGGFLFIGEAKTDVRRFDVPTVTDAAELASFVGADLLVLTAPNDLEPQQREALSAEVGDKGLQMEFLVGSQLLS